MSFFFKERGQKKALRRFNSVNIDAIAQRSRPQAYGLPEELAIESNVCSFKKGPNSLLALNSGIISDQYYALMYNYQEGSNEQCG